MKNKLLTLLIALIASVGTLFAEVISGSCGDNATWSYNSSTKTFTVSGSGAMKDYSVSSWLGNEIFNRDYQYSDVLHIVVEEGITKIGNYGFSGFSAATTVSLPSSLTWIGNYAFDGCSSIQSVQLPGNLTHIGRFAFNQCNTLSELTIPENVSEVYGYVISNCLNLETVHWNAINCTNLNTNETILSGSTLNNVIFGSSVQSIPHCLCQNASGITSISIPNSVTSIGSFAYWGTSLTKVVIPSNVKSVGNDAFGSTSKLLEVEIYGDITGNKVFYSSSYSAVNGVVHKLKKVILGGNIYGNNTFDRNMDSLRNVTILDGCQYIATETFKNVPITEITIPSTVTSLEANVFSCPSLRKIYYNAVSASCVPYYSVSSYYDMESPFGIIASHAEVIIGKDVQIIPEYMFSMARTSINYGSSNPQWSEDFINSNFSKIGNITSVQFEEGSVCQFIDKYAFTYQNLDSLILPDNITHIGKNAFAGNYQLKKLHLPQNVQYIEEGAFQYCRRFKKLEIPRNVIVIDKHAFDGCCDIKDFVWNARSCQDFNSALNSWLSLYSYDETQSYGSIQTITFGDEVQYIPAYLCNNTKGWEGVTSLHLPASVLSVGDGAFYSLPNVKRFVCENNNASVGSETGIYRFSKQELDSVVAPAGFFNYPSINVFGPERMTCVTVNGGVLDEGGFACINSSANTLKTIDIEATYNTHLEANSFKGCYKLEQVKLPSSLTYIGYMALADCKNLQEIVIPEYVCEIDDSAFENCRSLKTITFGGSANSAPGRHNAMMSSESQLERIGNWAFYNCHELQNLIIPDGVTEIGNGAFYGCVYLEDLSLPASVQSIGDNAFALCARMQKMIVNATVPPSIQSKTFYDVKRQIPVYVPDNSVSAYMNDSQWREFNIQGISNIQSAIDKITDNQPLTTKLLQDGQLYILRGQKTYTLHGQEVR